MRIIQATLSDASSSYALRCDAAYLSYMKQDFPALFSSKNFTRFGAIIKSVHNGVNIDKDAYSSKPTDYLYLSVTAIKKTGIVWNKAIFLREEVGKQLEESRLLDQQLVIGRSGTYVGLAAVFEESSANGKIIVPSGYTIVVDLDTSQAFPRFVASYLNSPNVQEYLVVCSTEKNQRNLTQRYLRNAPFPRMTKGEQEPVVKELLKLDQKRRQLIEEVASIDAEETRLMWGDRH